MKTLMKNFPWILLLLAVILFTQCGNKENASHDHSDGMTEQHMGANVEKNVPPKFQEQFDNVFAAYIKLKDAFVESNPGRVASEVNKLKQTLSEVDSSLLAGETRNTWTKVHEGMNGSIIEMQLTDDIEKQRTALSDLSTGMYEGVKNFGLKDETAYYQYCPMAFDNQGAYWLSDDKKIMNPYFGEKMLHCGSVKEVLP